jgi:hypothetical protein
VWDAFNQRHESHAAYLNFIRWYVSGEKAHADAAKNQLKLLMVTCGNKDGSSI